MHRFATRVALALALVAVVAACMPTSDAVTGAWKLAQINGAAPATEGALSLLPDGTFTMRPGCNTGGGTYTIEGNRIGTDRVHLTMMACDAAVMAQEQAFVRILESGPRFEIETGTGRLRLTADAGSLSFVAQ